MTENNTFDEHHIDLVEITLKHPGTLNKASWLPQTAPWWVYTSEGWSRRRTKGNPYPPPILPLNGSVLSLGSEIRKPISAVETFGENMACETVAVGWYDILRCSKKTCISWQGLLIVYTYSPVLKEGWKTNPLPQWLPPACLSSTPQVVIFVPGLHCSA